MGLVKYKNVSDVVYEMGDMTLYYHLRSFTPEKRLEDLERILLLFLGDHKDKESATILNFLVKAVDDVEVTPLLLFDDGGKYYDNEDEEVKKVFKNARKNRVSKMMEIFQELLGLGSQLHHMKVKEMIYKEVVSWWRMTKDEEEANKAFEFLLEVNSKLDLHEEIVLLHKIIRDETDAGFPLDRLITCVVYASSLATGISTPQNAKSFLRVLAHGIVKSRKIPMISQVIGAVQPITGCCSCDPSDNSHDIEALKLLEKYASEISKLHTRVQELKRVMNIGGGFGSWEEIEFLKKQGYEFVYGKIQFSYTDSNTIKISVEDIPEKIKGYIEGEDGHNQFDNIKKHILRWKKENPDMNVRVTIKLVVKRKYTQEIVFERSVIV